MDKTLAYYDNNAEKFVSDTFEVGFRDVQDRFISLLEKNSLILDFGCGSGRDAKYFLDRGFRVEAVDGSGELCRIASQNIGIEVKQMLFSELSEIERYDGIWACASVLHLPKDELSDVMVKMVRAVKAGGYIYMSFKYGDFEGFRNGRYFTDFTEEKFSDFISCISGLTVISKWISGDVRQGRGDERWLNLILQKSEVVCSLTDRCVMAWREP